MGNVVSFRSVMDAKAEDWAALKRYENTHPRAPIADFVLAMFETMRDIDSDGMPINAYQHSLQTATRALRAGADDTTVVVALLHDMADLVSGHNHGVVAAAILRPFVGDNHAWLLAHHATFQSYFFANHPDRDPTAFRKYEGHANFDMTLNFCREFDAPSFDPDYDTLPVEEFLPLVERVIRY